MLTTNHRMKSDQNVTVKASDVGVVFSACLVLIMQQINK